MRKKEEKSKYMFSWCKLCKGLRGCYYQHGEFKGPMFLDPDCSKGPMGVDVASNPDHHSPCH